MTAETDARIDACEMAAMRSAELGDPVPSEVLVAPWGVVESANGEFVVDDEAARLAIEAFAAQGTDLPIDYEHQTLGGEYASPTGQAPAAGWIKRLFLRAPGSVAGEGDARHESVTLTPSLSLEGRGGAETHTPALSLGVRGGVGAGLWAEVVWTEPARAQLVARQYRYLSPVVIVRKADRKLVALHSAALTNKPAIAGMRAIVNRVQGAQPSRPRHEAENTNSGHGETEGDRMTEAMERLREQLGLDKEREAEAVLATASERIAALTEAAQRTEAEARVMTAMEAGKLTEGQREWAVALAMRDPAAFEAWEASAPVVVSLGRMAEPKPDSAVGRDRAVLAAKARTEFRAHPELELLTSEEAYVAAAMR